jgi:3-mercaptopyruvate sulfurtransferase SseA
MRREAPCSFIGNIQITDDDLDLLEKLLEVDGRNGSMFIFDEHLRSALKQGGHIQANNINWVWGTDRLRSILPKLKKALERKAESDANEDAMVEGTIAVEG